jgi:hypothetical protein
MRNPSGTENTPFEESSMVRFLPPRANVCLKHLQFWKSAPAIEAENMSEEPSGLLTELGMDLTPNGVRLLDCGSHISLSAASSASSPNGVVTRGILNLALSELCELLTQHRWLQGAEIILAEACGEHRRGSVHLFLILELRHNGVRTLYLRLEGQEQTRPVSSGPEDATSNHHTVIRRRSTSPCI